jgi:hypothetical protein
MRSVTPAALRSIQNQGDVDTAVAAQAFDDKDGEVRVFDVDRFFDCPQIKRLSGR